MQEEEELQKILKKLIEKNKDVNLVTSLANQSHKFLTIENLIHELFQLKRKKNEDEALINMLKVQIRKLERPEGKDEKKVGKINFLKSQELYLFD